MVVILGFFFWVCVVRLVAILVVRLVIVIGVRVFLDIWDWLFFEWLVLGGKDFGLSDGSLAVVL